MVGLVALGEGVAVTAQQLGGALLAQLGVEGLTEAVGPGAGGLDEPRLDAVDVPIGEPGQLGALRDAYDEVEPGQDRFGVPGGEVDAGAAELLLEDVDQAQPDTGGVAVARQVDEGGVVAPVLVLAEVEAQPAPLLEVQDAGDDGAQLLDGRLEQLVARVRLQDLHQVAAVVAVRREAGALQDLGDLAPYDGHTAYGLGVRRRGEEAQEAALADDVALVVELLHADVVEIARTVHGGAAVGLRKDEQLVLAGLGTRVGREPVERRAHRVRLVVGVPRVGAQDAEAGAGHGGQRVVAGQFVLAVAEEGEVVVGEPAQQFARLFDLLVAQVVRGRLARQLVGDAQRGLAHLLPVLDGLAGVREDAQQVGGDLLEIGAVGLTVDLDVDPGLDQGVVRQLGALGPAFGKNLDQLARDIAAHQDLRVDDGVDAAVLPGEFVGDRVDQERHVVGDHLDDRVGARPAVLLDGRRVDPHVGRALRAVLGQSVVGERRAVDVDRIAVGEVVRGGVQVVPVEENEQRLVVRMPLVARTVSDPCRPCEQLGLGFVQLGLHVLWLLSRAVA